MNKKLIVSMFACLMLIIIICASSSINARLGLSSPPGSHHILQGTLVVYVEDGGVSPEATVTAMKMPLPSSSFINIPWDSSANAYIRDLPVGQYMVVVRLGLIQLVKYANIVNGLNTTLYFYV